MTTKKDVTRQYLWFYCDRCEEENIFEDSQDGGTKVYFYDSEKDCIEAGRDAFEYKDIDAKVILEIYRVGFTIVGIHEPTIEKVATIITETITVTKL